MMILLPTGSADQSFSQISLPCPGATSPDPSASCRHHRASPAPSCPNRRSLSARHHRGGSSLLANSATRLALLLLLMTSLLPMTSGGLLRRAFLEDELSPLLEEKEELVVQRRSRTDCDTDIHVSRVCYHCGALDRVVFHDVHEGCCHNRGSYRQQCEYLYTEDPKRGSSSLY